MKLFEMEGFLRGKCLPGDMKVNETNAEYLVRKFAEADAKIAALAAENAGMSAFVDALLSIAWQGCSADGADIEELALKHGLLRQEVYSADEHETLVDDPGNFEDGNPVYFRVETQATDDFLAEVRAAAVDEVCLKISNAIVNCYQDEQVGLDAAATICGDFAAQLRKGVQS
ncbi:TPA: hypothetical protein ACT92I_000783 [Enterobacter hormaechei subsp. xiangfangensis]